MSDPWEERRKKDFEYAVRIMTLDVGIERGDTFETCLNKVLAYLYKERERLNYEIERLEPRDANW